MYITVPLIIFLYMCNIIDYNYMLDCSWSRPIRTKSVFSRPGLGSSTVLVLGTCT